jgi:hypothetical protein
MFAMIDEIYDRDYQAGRAALNGALTAAFKHLGIEIRDTFEALNRIEYSAPWAARANKRCD